jgi:CRISPR/Cas system CSM-associated protein Csm2 small subunit
MTTYQFGDRQFRERELKKVEKLNGEITRIRAETNRIHSEMNMPHYWLRARLNAMRSDDYVNGRYSKEGTEISFHDMEVQINTLRAQASMLKHFAERLQEELDKVEAILEKGRSLE